jgi:predicted ATPase
MPGDAEWMQPLPIRRIMASREVSLPPGEWPMTLGPAAQLVRDGLVPGRATVLVGENGTGKSTIVEAIAMAYGLNAEGGSIHASHQTWTSESMLHTALRIERGPGASRWGYFVRAETMHGLFTFLDSTQAGRDPAFHRLSHGESFLALVDTGRFRGDGLFVMDEPEAGLSFTAQLSLVGSLASLARQSGTQVIVATHSPIIAALPGATILELDEDGFHETTWDDLDVVDHHRRFLQGPERYLRHLVD